MSSTPWDTRWAILRSIWATPATGSICFGVVNVKGRRRVPNPPTRIIAFILFYCLTVVVGAAGGWVVAVDVSAVADGLVTALEISSSLAADSGNGMSLISLSLG